MSVTAVTNPKDKIGSLKYPMGYVSRLVWGWVGVAMFEGARKYGGHNYRVAGVQAKVNITAAQHHIDAFWEGQDIDPDSGLHHLAKAIAALVVMYDGVLQGNWKDDRPPRNPDFQAQVDAMNAATKALMERYPNPVADFTELNNGIEIKGSDVYALNATYTANEVEAIMDESGAGTGVAVTRVTEPKRYTRLSQTSCMVVEDERAGQRRKETRAQFWPSYSYDRRKQPDRRRS